MGKFEGESGGKSSILLVKRGEEDVMVRALAQAPHHPHLQPGLCHPAASTAICTAFLLSSWHILCWEGAAPLPAIWFLHNLQGALPRQMLGSGPWPFLTEAEMGCFQRGPSLFKPLPPPCFVVLITTCYILFNKNLFSVCLLH